MDLSAAKLDELIPGFRRRVAQVGDVRKEETVALVSDRPRWIPAALLKMRDVEQQSHVL